MINHKLEQLFRTAQDAPYGSILNLTNFESSTSKRQFLTIYEVQCLLLEMVTQMQQHYLYTTIQSDDPEQRIAETFQEYQEFQALDTLDRFACLLQMLEDLEEYETTDPGADADWGPHAEALVKLGHDIRRMETQANLANLERMKERSHIYYKLQAKHIARQYQDPETLATLAPKPSAQEILEMVREQKRNQ